MGRFKGGFEPAFDAEGFIVVEFHSMPFLLADIDLCRPLEDIAVPSDRSGLGLLLRYKHRPVGFVMLPMNPGTSLSAEETWETIAHRLAPKLLKEKLREAFSPVGKDNDRSGDRSSVTVAVPLRFSSSETAAKANPRNWLPVSPMNTLAGGKL